MANKKDLEIDQGSNYVLHVLVKDSLGTPIDLIAGLYTSRLQMKASLKDGEVALLDLTTENNGLILHDEGVVGRISINIVPGDTESIEISTRTLQGVYDWELVQGAKVLRIYEGDMTIIKNTTT